MRQTWLALTIAASSYAIGSAAAVQPDRHRFAGNWVLNNEQSDRPIGLNGRGPEEGVDRGGRGGRGGGGRGRMGGGRFGGGFGGGGGRMGGQRPDPEQMEKMREVMTAMRQAPRRLVIIEKEDALVLTDEKGDIQRLLPDGQQHKQIFGTVQIDRTTKWKGNDLVTAIDAGGGMKLVQTYTILPETKQLSVTGTMENPRARNPGRAITFVYDLTPER